MELPGILLIFLITLLSNAGGAAASGILIPLIMIFFKF
jgi:hypothetical protein